MQDQSYSRRFPALYKAIGKMASPERQAKSPRGFDVEAEDDVDVKVDAPFRVAAEPAVRVRPLVAGVASHEWVLVEAAISSAERRAQRLARVRAEHELARERAKIVLAVSRLRQAKVDKEIRQSESAVRQLEERLKSGGHTGRLGWMQAQVSRRFLAGV